VTGDIVGVSDYDQSGFRKTMRFDYSMFGLPRLLPTNTMLGSLDVDTRSDMYSSGVVLYELLSGSTPLDAAGLVGKQRILAGQEPPTPSTRVTESASLRAIAGAKQLDASRLRTGVRVGMDRVVMGRDRERPIDALLIVQ